MAQRVTLTGASGLIGVALIEALQQRGTEVTILSHDVERARKRLRDAGLQPVEAFDWNLLTEPAPTEALEGRDAIAHLAGENVAQRWSADAKRSIRESRITGTRNL